MNDGEWWVAVQKAAQHWHELRNNQPGVAGKDLLRTADEGSRDSGKPSAERQGNERTMRGA
jgi:hypothetical protein